VKGATIRTPDPGVCHSIGQRSFVKDLDMSFKPFMGILGTGLVTAHGAHWQQQRVKVGLRLEL